MIKLKNIIDILDVVEFIGNSDDEIIDMIEFSSDNQSKNALMWLNEKNINKIQGLAIGSVICPVSKEINYHNGVNYIIVNKPRSAFRQVLKTFFMKLPKVEISNSANISDSSFIGLNCTIGNNVVIEENCIIGDNVRIDHNTVIKNGTIIHDNVIIGANCTLGGVGFGYEKDEDNNYTLIPHIGNVLLSTDVEIGNNVCIDRAVLGSTFLAKNVKVDNFVHIAHGVQIGENSLIIAHAMIAGSTKIGKNVWVAPSAAIINKCEIGDNSLVGMGAVVIKSVSPGKVVAGNPARDL